MRADLLIATFALLISGGATLSSLYQTKVIARQLSSSVWPYLTITSTTSTDKAFEEDLANDGLGPALIGGITVALDGHVLTSYREGQSLIKARFPKNARPAITASSFSSVGPTTVIRAGETSRMFLLKGTFIKYAGDLSHRVTVSTCYCSLLGECWNVTGQQPRVAVSECVHHGSIDF